MKNKKNAYILIFFTTIIFLMIYFYRFSVTDHENLYLDVYAENASGWSVTKFEGDKEVPMPVDEIMGYTDTIILRRTVEPYFADFHRINAFSISATSIFVEDELVFSTYDNPIEHIGEIPLLQYDPEVPFSLTFTVEPSWVGKTMTIVTREFENSPVGSVGIELINDYNSNLMHEASTNAKAIPAGAFGILSMLLVGLFFWNSITNKTDVTILLLALASFCLVIIQTSRLGECIFVNVSYGIAVSLLYLFTFIYTGLKLTKTKPVFLISSILIWLLYFGSYICIYYLYLPLPYWVDKITVICIIPLIGFIVACWVERRGNQFARLFPKVFLMYSILVAGLYVTAYCIGSEIYLHIKSLFLEAMNLYVEPLLIWVFTIFILSFFTLSIWEILHNKLQETRTIADLKLINGLHEQSLKHAEQTNSELAIMRHDELYHLRTLAVYLNEDIEKAREYLFSLSDDINKISTVHFSANKLINSILSAVNYRAKEQKVTFTALANVEETLALQDKDLTAVLMNLCDNALRAAQNSAKKMVNIELSQDNDMLYIKIYNSIPNDFDKNEFYQMLKSPIQNNDTLHGHGMISARNILTQYGGELHYEVKENDIVLSTVMQF